MPGILEGVKVLELGEQVSAPFCARLLADYGADVIKVEPPGEGDAARRMGPFAGDDPHPEKSIPFLYLNTNKRGVTLNLKTETGKGILAVLLQRADVVVENFHPAEAQALGLDFSTFSKINSELIVTSITPFGRTGTMPPPT